jgi:hypothetical protein
MMEEKEMASQVGALKNKVVNTETQSQTLRLASVIKAMGGWFLLSVHPLTPFPPLQFSLILLQL